MKIVMTMMGDKEEEGGNGGDNDDGMTMMRIKQGRR